MGELSAGRVALEGAQIALGDDATGDLQSPEHLYHSPSLIAHPERRIQVGRGWSVQYVRCARRGAAAGPSGMVADHLQPMLDSARDISFLFQFASVLASGHVPPTVVEAIRMGRSLFLGNSLEGCEASSLATSFADWSREPWPNKWQ